MTRRTPIPLNAHEADIAGRAATGVAGLRRQAAPTAHEWIETLHARYLAAIRARQQLFR